MKVSKSGYLQGRPKEISISQGYFIAGGDRLTPRRFMSSPAEAMAVIAFCRFFLSTNTAPEVATEMSAFRCYPYCP